MTWIAPPEGLEMLPVAVFLYEVDSGAVVYANPACLAVSGLEAAALRADPLALRAWTSPGGHPPGMRSFDVPGRADLRGCVLEEPVGGHARGSPDEVARRRRSGLVGELAATVAHDLTQPLTAIQSWIEGARMRLAPRLVGDAALAGVSTALDHALGQCRRAADSVQRLRAFIARGEVQALHVALGPAIERVARSVTGPAGGSVEIDAPERLAALPLVLGERIHIEVALLALLRHVRSLAPTSPLGVRVAAADAQKVVLAVPTLPGDAPAEAPCQTEDGLLGVAWAALEPIGARLTRVDSAEGPRLLVHLLVAPAAPAVD